MRTTTRTLITTAIAGFLLAAGGGMTPAAAQAPVEETISDERVMELARGYIELLYAGQYEQLWQHVSPAAKERFGTFDEFRVGSENVMKRLGTESLVVEETVEPARVGMIAHKVYHRIAHYTGAEGTPVRLTVGLVNDGTIGGLAARPVQ